MRELKRDSKQRKNEDGLSNDSDRMRQETLQEALEDSNKALESLVDSMKLINNALTKAAVYGVGEDLLRETFTNCYRGYQGLRLSIRDLEKEIKVAKNEIFGGRIGKVNATEKDAPGVVNSIRNRFSEREMDLKTSPYGFIIEGSYTIPKKNKTFFFTIDERAKDKICIDLKVGGKVIDQVKGLILNPTKITNALKKLMVDNGYDDLNDRLRATSIVNRALLQREFARRQQEAGERERDLRKEKEKDFEKLFKYYLHDLSLDRSPAIAREIEKKRDEFWKAYLERDIEPEKYGKEYFKKQAGRDIGYHDGTHDNYYSSTR